MERRPPPSAQIFVQTCGGPITVDVLLTDSVVSVKDKIATKTGIAPQRQRLECLGASS